MSEITPEVVSHLANLARIALTDDEIERLTGELGVIVDSVAKVQRGRDARRAGDQPPDPARHGDASGCGRARPSRPSRRSPGAPERDGDSFKVIVDPGGGAVSARLRADHRVRRRPRRAARRRRGLERRGDAGAPGPHRRGRRRRPRVPARERRGSRHRRRGRRAARGRRDARPRSRVCRSRSRTCSAPSTCPRRPGRRSSRAGFRPTTRPSSRGCARPAWCRSARPTWTSSRWARRPSTRRTAPTHNPWDLDAHPGRFRWRFGCGGGGVRGAARARLRHRWLDPSAGCRDRLGRHEADLRRGVALRRDRARVVARPGRPGDSHGARCRLCCTT